MIGVKAPQRMNGVDMSPLFDGKPLPKRDYAYGGYGNSFFIRTRELGHVGAQRAEALPPVRQEAATRARATTSPTATPAWSHHLYGLVRSRVGRLPYYQGVDRDG